MELEEIRKAIDRHLGQCEEIELEYETGTVTNEGPVIKKDKFKMNSIDVKDIPKLYDIMSIMKGADKDPTLIMDRITESWLNKLTSLALKCLKPHYQEIEDEVLEELIRRNFLVFFNHIVEQNTRMPGGGDVEKIRSRMDAYKTAVAGREEEGKSN